MSRKKQAYKRSYRMPNGELTTSSKDYADAWHTLANRIQPILGVGPAVAFDPDIAFQDDSARGVFSIPVHIAMNILKYAK